MRFVFNTHVDDPASRAAIVGLTALMIVLLFTLLPAGRDLAAGLPTPFAESVLDLVEQIPPGRVMAYGAMGGDGQPQTQAAATVLLSLNPDDHASALWRLDHAHGKRAVDAVLAEESNIKEANHVPTLEESLQSVAHPPEGMNL